MRTHANTTGITRELANMKTRSGSVYNTCDHEKLSGKCIHHLLPRKREREVYTTLATTITLRRQRMQHLQTRKLERTTLAKGADKHLQLRLHKRLYQFLSHRRFMKLHRVSCKTISFNREEWPTVVGTQQDRQIVRQLIKEQRSNAQFTLRFGIFA